MKLRSARSVLVSLSTTCLLLAGCGDDDSTGPGGSSAADFGGSWAANLEVVSKQTCFQPVGTQFSERVRIAQDGRSASLWLFSTPFALSINGTRATGNGAGPRDGQIEIDLNLAEGQLGGTITTSYGGAEPCTEVLSVSGSRDNVAASPGWVADWDLQTEVTSTTCAEETVGETESLCRSIAVDGSTISIEDPEGSVRGVVDGDTAFLWRVTEEERLEISLTLSGSDLSGTIYAAELDDFCDSYLSIEGSARSGACPPPASAESFVGDWFVGSADYQNSGCPDQEAQQFIGRCISVSRQGSTIIVDDGASAGVLTGSVVGDAAVVSRTDVDGTYTMLLERDGDDLHVEGEKSFPDSPCFESSIEYFYDAFSLGISCDTPSSGAWAGFWGASAQLVESDCEDVFGGFGCTEFLQFGNTVFLDEMGQPGTVSGDVLTSVEEGSVIGGGTFRNELTLQLAAGGDSFSGTQTITIEGTDSSDCTATWTVTGTRLESCDPSSPGRLQWSGTQLLLPDPRVDE